MAGYFIGVSPMTRFSQSQWQGRRREAGLKEAQSEAKGDEQEPNMRRDASATNARSPMYLTFYFRPHFARTLFA
jgi:hypothetical protein